MKKDYLESVSMSGLFKYLAKEKHKKAWEELHMAPHNYSHEQIIFEQGDSVKRAAIVHSGLVKGEKLHAEGLSHLAYVYSRGETFAFEGAVSGKHTSPLDFSADGNSTVIFFDVQRVFAGSFEKELTKALMELLANDNIKKLYRIETLSQRGLRDRIMTHFNIMSAKSKSPTFALNMSREQLARYLCVNRTALSYELNEMKREGMIAFDKKTVTLLNKSGLSDPLKR